MKVNVVKLKLLAAERDLTVRELAAKSGVAFATVCKARAGKAVSERVITKLAKALGIEAHDLIIEAQEAAE